MSPRKSKKKKRVERLSVKATRWVGSDQSLIVHTILFVVAFVLVFVGVSFERILLVVTTLVSLEAIYLAIFIQMSVNKQASRLREVSKDIEEIQEDIDEIQEDFEDINEEADTYEKTEKTQNEAMMNKIEGSLLELMREIRDIKKSKH